MKKFPKILGYLGVLPFFFLLMLMIIELSLVSAGEQVNLSQYLLIQICYASMILSFLGGVHWPLALRDSDNRRLVFSLVPTIVSIFILIYSFLINPTNSLLAVTILFILVYFIDKKYTNPHDFPSGYMTFRRNITLLVSLILLLSFGISL